MLLAGDERWTVTPRSIARQSAVLSYNGERFRNAMSLDAASPRAIAMTRSPHTDLTVPLLYRLKYVGVAISTAKMQCAVLQYFHEDIN